MTTGTSQPTAATESQLERDAYWQAGFEDGSIGQTWLEHRRVLQSEAEHDKAAEVASIEQRLEDAKGELAILTAEGATERADYERTREQIHAVRLDRERYPSQYSAAIASVFIVCAAFMLIADFPLSRAIAEQILEERAATLLSHTNAVALGILGMGIFFKLLADPFTRPRYLLPRFMRPVTWLITSGLAILIAAGLATVLGLLGIFRADTLRHDANSGGASVVYGAPAGPSSITPNAPPAPSGPVQRALAGDIDFVSKVAFLTLGLVLPILGGIFLSTGTTRLHNRAHARELERRFPERRKTFEEHTRRLHAVAATIATLERESELAKKRPTTANSRYHRYLHGYERGLCTAPGPSSAAGEVRDFIRRWLTAARQRDHMLRTQAVASTHTGFDPE